MDVHKTRFMTIDVVRFKRVDEEDEEEDQGGETVNAKKQAFGPVTMWIGVAPEDYKITDVEVEYREFLYTREVGPQLLRPVNGVDPLFDVISPLTPTLGLHISTKARTEAQGTMALYLAECGDSDNLLGLTCRHVLIGSNEGNDGYVHHPCAPSRDVLLLGERAFTNSIDSIKLKIERQGFHAERGRKRIKEFTEREKGTDTVDVENAKVTRIRTQRLLEEDENAMEALEAFLDQVNKDWKKLDNRVLGHIVRSPAIGPGVDVRRFTEDWGIDRAKLGDGFQGNKMDLGAF